MALITSAATLVIVVVVSPLFLHAQALVEYGAMAGKTSAATPHAAAAGIDRAMQRVGSSLAHQGSPEGTRSTSSATAVRKAGSGTAATVPPASPHDVVEIQGAAVRKDQVNQPRSKYRNSVTVSF